MGEHRDLCSDGLARPRTTVGATGFFSYTTKGPGCKHPGPRPARATLLGVVGHSAREVEQLVSS